MSFLERLLARSQGHANAAAVRPRHRTAFEPPAMSAEPNTHTDGNDAPVRRSSLRQGTQSEPTSSLPRRRQAPVNDAPFREKAEPVGRSPAAAVPPSPVEVIRESRTRVIVRDAPAVRLPPSAQPIPAEAAVNAKSAHAAPTASPANVATRSPVRSPPAARAADVPATSEAATRRVRVPVVRAARDPEAALSQRARDEPSERPSNENSVVHIHIGRIDVRAIQDAPPPARIPSPHTPRLSIEDYARQRERGER